MRLSQRQVRRLTAGNHLSNLRVLLQGGVFQITLKVESATSANKAIVPDARVISDLVRLVTLNQFHSITIPQQATSAGASLPVRAILIPSSVEDGSRHGLSHNTV